MVQDLLNYPFLYLLVYLRKHIICIILCRLNIFNLFYSFNLLPVMSINIIVSCLQALVPRRFVPTVMLRSYNIASKPTNRFECLGSHKYGPLYMSPIYTTNEVFGSGSWTTELDLAILESNSWQKTYRVDIMCALDLIIVPSRSP